MISLLIFGLIASAYAAPHFEGTWPHHHYHRGPSRFMSQYHHHSHDSNDYFDANKFWTDFNKEMQDLEKKLTELSNHFPTGFTQEGVVDNEYRITIPLSGFEEKEIIVKAREGCLSIQAHHKNSEGNENNYLNFRTLPTTVKLDGKWKYENGVLKITFPLKEGVETQTVESVGVVSTDLTTELPKLDREDVDETYVKGSVNSQDTDAGKNRGDMASVDNTYSIDDRLGVEATTHTVDLKNEVEFVPVKY